MNNTPAAVLAASGSAAAIVGVLLLAGVAWALIGCGAVLLVAGVLAYDPGQGRR